MKQQTAVEWLINELVELDKLLDGRRKNEDDTVFKLPPDKLYEQALEKEKEQILISFSVGNDCGYCFAKTEDTQQYNSGEQYYNETFKYAKIEHAIIEWSNDNTKTAGELTRQILKLVENK